MKTNSILATADSYKFGHSLLLPDNCKSQYNYMESRGGLYPKTVVVGMGFFLQEYLTKVPTTTDIERFERLAALHGVPFDKPMWDHINSLGYYPVRIKAVPEGTVLPVSHVIATFESTDPKAVGIVGFLETLFMKMWMPITVATKSYYVRKMLERYGSKEWAQYAYHNFGNRSATSEEHAMLAGFGHLTQFKGTDSFGSLAFAEDYYNQPLGEAAGHSVIATEHSITTMNGKAGEEAFVYKILIENPSSNIISFVSDSYDPYLFTHMCTDPSSRIRKLIESRPHQKLVLRPDSGDPVEVINRMLNIMTSNGLATMEYADGNPKTLFLDFGILYGDGITHQVIETILHINLTNGYAAENFVFGSGTDLVNSKNRDTQRFAIKCSSITVDNGSPIDNGDNETLTWEPSLVDIDVFKDPITAPGKKSKKGKVTTFYHPKSGEYFCERVGYSDGLSYEVLEPVFENGKLIKETSLKEIRELSK